MIRKILGKTSTTFVLTTIAGAFLLSLACFGNVTAATTDALQPADTITYNEDLIVNGTGRFDSIYIGKQSTGGVTFFNGTIVNNTTGDNSSDNPVTFGDNVRIDGSIQRGAAGINDGKPVKIGDDFRVDGVIWGGPNKGNVADGQSLVYADSMRPAMDDINDFGSSSYRWKNGYYSGTLAAGILTVQGDATVGGDVNATYDLIAGGHLQVTGNANIDGTITGTLADDIVTSGNIADGTIVGFDIASGAVGANHLDSGATFTVGGINWDTPKENYFVNASVDCTGTGISFDTGSCLNSGGGTHRTYYQINLPHNSIVTSFRGLLIDEDGTDKMQCTLYRVYANQGGLPSPYLMANLTTTDADNDSNGFLKEDTSIDGDTIDNTTFQYIISCTAPNNTNKDKLGIYSLTTTYTTLSAN